MNHSQAAVYFAADQSEVIARNPALKLMVAEALLKSGRLGKAKEQLAGLSDLSPDEKFRLGWLLGQSREYHVAISAFNSLPHDYRAASKPRR